MKQEREEEGKEERGKRESDKEWKRKEELTENWTYRRNIKIEEKEKRKKREEKTTRGIMNEEMAKRE